MHKCIYEFENCGYICKYLWFMWWVVGFDKCVFLNPLIKYYYLLSHNVWGKKCVMKESSFVPQFLMIWQWTLFSINCVYIECRENIYKLHCGEGLTTLAN